MERSRKIGTEMILFVILQLQIQLTPQEPGHDRYYMMHALNLVTRQSVL